MVSSRIAIHVLSVTAGFADSHDERHPMSSSPKVAAPRSTMRELGETPLSL
jgi:hypothetical protein